MEPDVLVNARGNAHPIKLDFTWSSLSVEMQSVDIETTIQSLPLLQDLQQGPP